MMKGSSPSPVNRLGIQDQLPSPNNLDPDMSSYILSRRRTNKSLESRDVDSPPVSPSFGLNQARANQTSGSSQKSNLDTTVTTSAGSFSTRESKYLPNVSDWNERVLRDSTAGNFEPTPRHAADPPRPPKDGFEWVWFPEGYWAEREWRDFTARKPHKRPKWLSRSQVKHSSANMSVKSNSPPALEPPKLKIESKSLEPSSNGSQSAEDGIIEAVSLQPISKLRRGLQLMNPTYPHFIAPDGNPEGLYCKTRRTIESRFKKSPKRVRI